VRARYAEGRAAGPVCARSPSRRVRIRSVLRRFSARTAGNGAWLAPVVMSATTFAGSAQFAVRVDPPRRRPRPSAAIPGPAVFLNARYVPIGISRSPRRSRASVPKRLVQSQLVVGRILGRFGSIAKAGFDVARCCSAPADCSTSAGNLGTVVGVLLGNAIGDANRLGLGRRPFRRSFLAPARPPNSTKPPQAGRRAARRWGSAARCSFRSTPGRRADHRRLRRPVLVGWRSEWSAVWLLRDRGRRRDDRLQGPPARCSSVAAASSPAGLAGPVTYLAPCGTRRRWSSRQTLAGHPRDRLRRTTRGTSQRGAGLAVAHPGAAARGRRASAARQTAALVPPWSRAVGRSAHNQHSSRVAMRARVPLGSLAGRG